MLSVVDAKKEPIWDSRGGYGRERSLVEIGDSSKDAGTQWMNGNISKVEDFKMHTAAGILIYFLIFNGIVEEVWSYKMIFDRLHWLTKIVLKKW